MWNTLCMILAEDAPESAYSACMRAKERLSAQGKGAVICRNAQEAAVCENDETLFLADDAVTAYHLRDAGYAVSGLLHEGNAGTSFDGIAYVFAEPDEVDTDSYEKAWQRCQGIPWEILTTKRLRLRETTVADIDAFYEIYKDPEMTRFMEGLFPDPADEKRYMEDYIRNVYHLTGFGVWTVLERETSDIIGRCGFSLRSGFDRVELGFLIGVPWQHKGYAKEMIAAVLDYGRSVLQFETVQALVREGNDISLRLLEQAGFECARTIDVEEDIYGGVYPGFGRGKVTLTPARRGRYTEMIKTL